MLECWKGFAPLASGAAFPFRFIEYARKSNQSIQVHLLYLFFGGYVIFHTVFCDSFLAGIYYRMTTVQSL